MSSKPTSWLTINGESNTELEAKLAALVANKIATKEYEQRDLEYIDMLKRPLIDGSLITSTQRLEKLRTLCQLWDVDIKAVKITSHRPVIGPIIVAFKKALQPIIKILLKDFIRQQKDFNAATISLLADLSNEAKLPNNPVERDSHQH